MIKAVKFIIVAILLISSFFAGVKYSDSIKSHASWLFESKDAEEVELPDLSKESNVEITAPGEDGGANSAAQTEAESPMDNIETTPSTKAK
jgi:hypothetical protein